MMAYASFSVVFGEQPSAAKWNILGTNDASFNDGTGIADDKIHSRHIDWAATGGVSGDSGGIWWEELGRDTLSGAGDTLSVASLPARKYLMLLIYVADTGGTISGRFKFNNDGGSNYSTRYSSNGAADTTETSNSTGIPFKTTLAEPSTGTFHVINVAGQEKLVSGESTSRGTAGAAAAPNKLDCSGKWSNTSDLISRVDAVNSGAGDYAIGSELVVLGHN